MAFAAHPPRVWPGGALRWGRGGGADARHRPRRRSAARCSASRARAAPASPQAQSLADGTWFKMICGASSNDLPRIRNLALIYAALGADCVDAAADPGVVAAVRAGFAAAAALPPDMAAPRPAPWLMVSVCDDEDPHFRKATFAAAACPAACPRPCEAVCPADAIDATGVLPDICYGCGRCVPVCPEELVSTVPYVHTPASVCGLLATADAVEIHTSRGHDADFARLWRAIGPTAVERVRLVAVSFPNPGADGELAQYLRMVWGVLAGLPEHIELVWQADGRPMSGDIGRGTARASVRLGSRVRDALRRENIPGHVQLAGGTNDASAPLLADAGLLHTSGGVAGIAVGGFARKIVGKTLDELEARGVGNLEDDVELLKSAMAIARPLVDSVKRRP